ncbi:AAA family ATPase [Flavobacterium marginilacus]|uniref:AAA family ATPase n=1 Tax=Flavobacterium marginilacus TaxID=3003256 RepID=UPI00248E6F30|nr:AAA family ATPase [Flavobacterium marginilacus]
MKLLKFEANGVHKYLNYDFLLNERLTFLIGINGSGKTSVLKLILGLVSPSYNYLNSIEHTFAKIDCELNGKLLTIKSSKIDESKLQISLQFDNEEEINDIIHRTEKTDDMDSEDYHKLNSLHLQNFETLEVIKKIKDLSTPFFLGLDRRIYEGQQIDKIRSSYYTRSRYGKFPLNDHLNRSLIEIQEVIYDYFRLIASEQPRINEEFKNNVLLQSFEFIESREFNILKDTRELAEKRENAFETFKNLKVDGISESLNKFFDQLNDTLREFNEVQKRRKANNNDLKPQDIDVIQKWFNNQPQLKKIDNLISFNKTYQDEIQKLYEPIEKTRTIINEFLNESRKELLINTKGELKIKLKNNDTVNLYELSSGEKQIITMLGHLIYFVEKSKDEPGIFIIDEPEVSLHLAWQEIFVKSIMDASPNTQFIIATHSPAIINEHSEEICNDLAKMNL